MSTERGASGRRRASGGSGWRSGLLLLAYSLAMGVALLGLLELGARLIVVEPGGDVPAQGGYIDLLGEPDDLLFWHLKPGLRNVEGRISTNSLGLRGPEIEPKRAGELRVLSLGESTTLAPRIEYEESYSAVLESLLRKRRQGPVRVINAGVSGYTSFQGLQYLLHRGLALEPDVVLLYFGFNDFLETTYFASRSSAGAAALALNDQQIFGLRRRPLRRLGTWLAGHSRLVTLWSWIRRRGADPQVERSEGLRVPAELREEILERFADTCAQEGIRLIIVVPVYASFEEHEPLLRSFARDRHIPLVDLPARLEGRLEEPREQHFFDPVHPKPAVHRRIAEAIADVMEAEGLTATP